MRTWATMCTCRHCVGVTSMNELINARRLVAWRLAMNVWGLPPRGLQDFWQVYWNLLDSEGNEHDIPGND